MIYNIIHEKFAQDSTSICVEEGEGIGINTVTTKIKIDGKSRKVFGTYGSERQAKDRIHLEYEGGMSLRKKSELGIRKTYVGKSVDPAYSDSEGYAYIIYWK